MLLTAYVLAFVDRQILNLLVEPLKRELRLSDLQISLLQGPAFALLLATAGLPIGRLVDAGRRVGVLWRGVATWSLATVACALAPAYPWLLLARVGVGAGEATMNPCAYSMLGDVFPRRRWGAAIGVYAMGPYLGGGLALTGGGALLGALPEHGLALPVVGPVSGWRLAMLLIGLAGAPAALLVASLPEPARIQAGDRAPAWSEVRAYYRANGWAVAGMNAAVVFAAMASYAISAWVPAMLARRFDMPLRVVGRDFGLIVIASGIAGAMVAGWIGDALRRRGWASGRLRTLAAAATVAAPLAIAAPCAPSAESAMALLAPLLFLTTIAVSSGPATLQEITPNRLRGVQHAVAVLSINLVGLSLGPPVVALVTDQLLGDERKVWLALACTMPVMLALSSLCAVLAAPAYRRAIARVAS